MAEKSMLGDLLTRVQKTRQSARDRAIAELYKRNQLTAGTPGYRVAETSTLRENGKEITEYRLYKLVDCAVTTITSEVNVDTALGLDSIHERLR